ncbi:MAG TPA: penicillin-binding transpeptidase domain-containing protein, partial [Propionibacteriaceae bacterium]|nr:penicillin-binding transpeptidase domain-containing protein [Propionibacteriaceae bacterium]
HDARERSGAATDDVSGGQRGHWVQCSDFGRCGRRQTGTAQSDPKRKPFAWFTSFAPLDDPKIAVAVIVEDADIPRNDIGGGRLAAPIARAVMQAAL